MKIAIVGATGGIGRQALEQAVAAGHDVTAVVRDPGRLSRDVPSVQANLATADPAVLASALAGADAVLSGLGPRSRADAGVASHGTAAIVAAMTAAGVRRVLAVSAAPVATVPSAAHPTPPKHDPGDGPDTRYLLSPLIKRVLGGVYADLARMEDILDASGLDWTVVRPPRLTNGPLTGNYRTAVDRNIRRGLTISRADVAHLMLGMLDRPETVRQAVRIAY
jgi:putative NADH-flavin reductase